MKLCSLTSREIFFFRGLAKRLVSVSLLAEGSSRGIKKLQRLIGGFKFCTKFRIKIKYYGQTLSVNWREEKSLYSLAAKYE
jgi:hypothetical protein